MTVINSNEASSQSAAAARKQIRFSYEHVQAVALVIDIVFIVMVSTISGTVYHIAIFGNEGDIAQYTSSGFLTALIFVLAVNSRELYTGHDLMDVNKQVKNIILLWIFTFFVLTSIAFSLKISEVISRGYVGLFFIAGLVGLISSRLLWQQFLRAALDRGLFVRRRILAICEEDAAAAVPCISELQRYGHTPVSTIKVAESDIEPERIQALVRQAAAAARNLNVDEIVVAISIHRIALVTQIVEGLRALPLPVRFAVEGAAAQLIFRPPQQLGNIMSFQVQRHPLSVTDRILKRTLDIVIASTALLVLMPSMLITAIAIKLDSAGPILFQQLRYGVNGKRFRILKFRSMTVTVDGTDFQQARRGDPRVTWVGRIIRQRSIDELPQLWNVLRGEMSIVGPRPHAVAHDDEYEDLILRYAMRRFMKPGLTGWAQVNGSRGETPTIDSMITRLQYDLWYIDNCSIWLDMSIIFRTFIVLFDPKDVY